ncbi:amino acid adenylation domain-containing protein [Pedobacter sp. WC2423]|uniref:amino acid adenylation domain-containing protein n=1 Tax=Pedobacter sp. WC2423 TaxID=3234142 RepID=UPI00346778C0
MIKRYNLSPQQSITYLTDSDSYNVMSFSLDETYSRKFYDAVEEVLNDELCIYMSIASLGKEAILSVGEERNFEVKLLRKEEIENAENQTYKKHNLSITIVQNNEHIVSVTFKYCLYYFDNWSIITLYHRILKKYHTGTYEKSDVDYLQYSAWREHIISEEENEENLEFWKDIMKNFRPFRTNLELNLSEPGKRKTQIHKLGDKLVQVLRKPPIDKEILLLSGLHYTLSQVSADKNAAYGLGYVSHGRSFDQLYNNIGLYANPLPFSAEAIKGFSKIEEYCGSIAKLMMLLNSRKEYIPYNQDYSDFMKSNFRYIFEFIDLGVITKDKTQVSQIIDHRNNYSGLITQVYSAQDETTIALHHNDTIRSEDIAYFMQLWEHNTIQLIEKFHENIDAIESDETGSAKQLKKESTETGESLLDRYFDIVQHFPDRIAIEDENGKYSYKQIDDKSNELSALILQKISDTSSPTIGVMYDADYHLIVAFLAILKINGSIVPIDPNDSGQRIKHILNNVNAQLLITGSSYQKEEFEPKLFIDTLNLTGTNSKADNFFKSSVRTPDSTSYIIYTSGTTGVPKGVCIQDKSLINYIDFLNGTLDISHNDTSILLSSYAFDLGYTSLWGTLLSGGKLHMVKKDTLYDVDDVISKIIDKKITYIKTTPSYFNAILNAKDFHKIEGSALKKIILGGEKIKTKDLTDFKKYFQNIELINHYGPTETTIGTVFKRIKSIEKYAERPVIGTPIPNNFVVVLDERNKEVQKYETGNIYIGGAGLAKGYLHNDDLTSEKFIVHPEYGRMYTTGDVGFFTLENEIMFLGRGDSQVKIRGYRVEPDEVKNVISSFPEVTDAVVLPVENNGDTGLCAFIAGFSKEKASVLEEFLKISLPEYMIPAKILFIDKVPLTTNNKVDLKALQHLYEEDKSGKGISGLYKEKGSFVTTELHGPLLRIWKETLMVDEITGSSNFFSLGGHSLKGIQMLNKIYKEFNIKITLGDIYKYPEFEGLSGFLLEKVNQSDESRYTRIYPVPVQSRYEVSNSQKRMWLSTIKKESAALFNVPMHYLINGALNIDAIKASFLALIQKHETLRTVFKYEDGDIYQYILSIEDIDLHIPVVDITDTSLIISFLRQERYKSFDLSRELPIRLTLIKKSETAYILATTLHHIISDGWSRKLLYKEIKENYNTYLKDRHIDIRPLAIQYKDYVSWHKRKYNTYEDFWKSFFSEDIPALDFPIDYVRPGMISYNGTAISTTLTKNLAGLKQSLKERSLSLNNYLIGIYGLLIHAYTDQSKFYIGTISSGRTHVDTEQIIGSFINYLPLKIKVSSGMNLNTFLEENTKGFVQVYENEDYPFDLMVEKYLLSNDASRNPFFDTTIILHNEEEVSRKVFFDDGVEIEEFIHEEEIGTHSKIEFKIDLTIRKEELNIRLEYNTDIFSESKMRKFLQLYSDLIEKMVNNYGDTLNEVIDALRIEISQDQEFLI